MRTPIPRRHLREFLNRFLPLVSNETTAKFEDMDIFEDITDEKKKSILAFLVAYPVTSEYQHEAVDEDSDRSWYNKCGDDEDVVWFKQMFPYTPSLYGLLHIMSNGSTEHHAGNYLPPPFSRPIPSQQHVNISFPLVTV